MKTKYALVICFCLLSCGEDGKDGDAFIAFDWSSSVSSYSDNNSATPSIVYRNQNYKTSPGSYSCTWYAETSTSSVLWKGTYTIAVNKGAKGEFLTNGEDGSDKYFKLYLSSSGYSFGKESYQYKNDQSQLVLNDDKEIPNKTPSKSEILHSRPDTLIKGNTMLIFNLTEKIEYPLQK